MIITINDNLTALIIDDADAPTKMLRMPSYDLETRKPFGSVAQAQAQAEKYSAETHLFVDYVSPEEEAALEADKAKATKIAQINAEFEQTVAALTEGYTESEIKSWDMQVNEAVAYQADNTASTPLLDAMVATSGGTKADLVVRIAMKADAYSKAYGAALGKKQKAIADLG